ncbi:MAG: aminopeptidase P family N-terminal domain-containing protein, partial [Actinomycetota bacterium]|nr:aminopeptidase P family N-terminal domain-containing protein [Actinomycetota bacterium]
MDMAGRLARVRAATAGAGCDALLVTNLRNVRYLTGFTGSAGLLLVRADDVVLATDGRYRVQSAEQLAAAGVEASIAVGGQAEQRAA